MIRQAFSAGVMLAIVAGLLGCMGEARLVRQDKTGGVVAIPENTNVWPTYYRDEAVRKIKELHPNFDPRTDILSEGEVAIGKETSNVQSSNGKASLSVTTDEKEYRIQYVTRPTLVGGGSMNNGVTPAGGIQKPNDRMQPMGQPVGGTPLSVDSPPNRSSNANQPPVDPRTGLPVGYQNNSGIR